MTSPSESSKSAPAGDGERSDTRDQTRPSQVQKARRDALTRVRHDLRSSVHSVIGYSDLLATPRYGSLSAEQARFLDHLRAAASQLEELVDTCIELTRLPETEARLPTGTVPLSAALKHIQAGLTSEPLVCDLEVEAEVAAHPCAHELPVFLRALRSLALVVTHEGALPCTLRAFATGSSAPAVELWAGDQRGAVSWSILDALEAELSNRDFVRLKLGEVLLQRLGISLTITADLAACKLCFG